MQENGRPQRAGIYCRLSYAPDGSVEKVERQEADCRELAERLVWPVSEGHVFPDNSRSAWQRNRKRPAWDRMLKAIEAGEIDAVIVYHGDRLIRQPWDLEVLLNIAREKGVRLASPSGTRNLDSPDDQFILRIEAAQACRESDNISRRQKRGVDARVAKGRGQSGGKRPFGWGVPTGRVRVKTNRETGEETEIPILDYNKTVPAETAYLYEAAERLLAGQSLAGAVRWLNDEGITTTEGGPWSSRTLRGLLSSPRMAGLIERNGVFHEAVWDAAIPREMWGDLRALFASNSEAHPNLGPGRVRLLSGIAECGPCDGGMIRTKPMGGRKKPKTGGRVYYCRDCHKVARNVALLDAYIEGMTVQLLGDPRLAREVLSTDESGAVGVGAEIAALERRKATARKQLEALADHPEIDAGLVARSLVSFDRRIEELRGRMAASSERRLLTRLLGVSREQWDAEPVDVRAVVVQMLFRVVILPRARRGPGFDPSSVRVTRRPLQAPS